MKDFDAIVAFLEDNDYNYKVLTGRVAKVYVRNSDRDMVMSASIKELDDDNLRWNGWEDNLSAAKVATRVEEFCGRNNV